MYVGEARGLVEVGRLAALCVVDIGRWGFVLRYLQSCRPFSIFFFLGSPFILPRHSRSLPGLLV